MSRLFRAGRLIERRLRTPRHRPDQPKPIPSSAAQATTPRIPDAASPGVRSPAARRPRPEAADAPARSGRPAKQAAAMNASAPAEACCRQRRRRGVRRTAATRWGVRSSSSERAQAARQPESSHEAARKSPDRPLRRRRRAETIGPRLQPLQRPFALFAPMASCEIRFLPSQDSQRTRGTTWKRTLTAADRHQTNVQNEAHPPPESLRTVICADPFG